MKRIKEHLLVIGCGCLLHITIHTAALPPHESALTTLALVQQELALLVDSIQKPLLMDTLPSNTYLLDQSLNIYAPTKDMLRKVAQKTGVEVVQLVCVWQDLFYDVIAGFNRLATFPEFYQTAFDLGFIAASGSIDLAQQLLNLFARTNKVYFDLLKTNDERFSASLVNIGGGDASCGYHALRNISLVFQALSSQQYAGLDELINFSGAALLYASQNLNDRLPPSSQFLAEWRAAIITRDNTTSPPGEAVFRIEKSDVDKGTGDWLNAGDIAYLREKFLKTALPEQQISILSHQTLSNLARAAHPQAPKLPHAYVLQMENHWIGVCVQRANAQRYQIIIVDSKNKPRYYDQFVTDIITLCKETPTRIFEQPPPPDISCATLTNQALQSSLTPEPITIEAIDKARKKEGKNQLSEAEIKCFNAGNKLKPPSLK